MKHKTHRIAIVVMTIIALSTIQNAEAQFFGLWGGDSRFGIMAGINHAFKPMALSIPTGYTLDGKATTAFVTPSFGIYSGVEQEITGTLAFGFDGKAYYNKLVTNATLLDAAGTTYDYSFSAHSFAVTENIYMAYEFLDDIQTNLGVGLYERFMMGSKAISKSDITTAPSCGFDDLSGSGFDFGLSITAGVTYNFGESFYAKGSIDALIPLYSSKEITDTWGHEYNSNDGNSLIAYTNSGFDLGLTVGIGFRW